MSTTRFSAVMEPEVPGFQDTGALSEYEGVRLVTDDLGKLVKFTDQLLFFLRVTRRKARPLTIRESSGIVEIEWKGRVPKPFRPGTHGLLCISEGEHVDVFSVAT